METTLDRKAAAMTEGSYRKIAPKIIAQRPSLSLIPPTKEEFVRHFTAEHKEFIGVTWNALICTVSPLALISLFEYQAGWGNSLTTIVKWGLMCAAGIEASVLLFQSRTTPEHIDKYSQKMVEAGVRLNRR